jgi:polyhydroxyalkanoate synthase subunit PhaC
MRAPTPKDVLFNDAGASLYRFRPAAPVAAAKAPPVLLVPSMINRWYVLDLRVGASLATALVDKGLDVWCLDWGVPQDEDRYFSWEDVLARMDRMVRRVRRQTGAKRISIMGYCMGATVSGIHCALEPEGIASFVNLLGPFDFSQAGFLGTMTREDIFDADAVADAGNVSPNQMQSGFMMLRPTQGLSKLVGLMDRGMDPKFRDGYDALEEWASDNVAFPADAYRTYIKELYQQNRLIKGEHRVRGREVKLERISCPVMTVTASRDAICPPLAANALNSKVQKSQTLEVPGGHVGAVVGGAAQRALYPALAKFFSEAQA